MGAVAQTQVGCQLPVASVVASFESRKGEAGDFVMAVSFSRESLTRRDEPLPIALLIGRGNGT